MLYFGELCYFNQYNEISDDEIFGYANTKFPTTKFPPPVFLASSQSIGTKGHCATFFRFLLNPNALPRFSTETTAFCEHRWPLLVLRYYATYLFGFLKFSVKEMSFLSLEGDLFATFRSCGTDEFF